MDLERDPDVWVFRAGPGEPANAAGGDLRDLGDEVAAPLPPSRWHRALEDALASPTAVPRHLVVDVSAMHALTVEDFGFLVRVGDRLAARGARTSLVGTPRVARQVAVLGLDARWPVHARVQDALRG